jgi:uncharacterized protein YecE (DUF72 family)
MLDVYGIFSKFFQGIIHTQSNFGTITWYAQEVYRLLQQHNVALCLHDWHSEPWAQEITASFSYIRFHGTGGRYAGNYPGHRLNGWAHQIQSWAGRLNEIYVYFNNDVGGHAIRNARSLRCAVAKLVDTHSRSTKSRAA